MESGSREHYYVGWAAIALLAIQLCSGIYTIREKLLLLLRKGIYTIPEGYNALELQFM